MANNFFKFKQFTVNQHNATMKVCTDACLFAAWVGGNVESSKTEIESVLDIGTGTGLLALMLAQKTNAQIDAVEIDPDAAQQAKENFEASPWSNRLTIHNTSIQHFNTTNSYDLIISNPPFFQQSLRSENEHKNLAKHSGNLSFLELINVVLKLLNPSGSFNLLLPYSEFKTFEIIAKENDLHLLQKTNVRQTPSHTFFRTMGTFIKQPSTVAATESLSIKNDENNYTAGFIKLLKEYYLNL
jgi:tRNA1Val (adenine37-N6)-methyltransferase